ncbi:phage tail protein [Clostridium saccharobutylicum]|uniref:phage tail protein n=1 Tax=Clostridium saccharobutylicum TaxID=169679 RepID=UPI0017DAAE5B|nr:phage tail protein [Clostridium saccharobutylicum]MBA9009547.1 hypothetical protein [Clostridium saccharobutylicum]
MAEQFYTILTNSGKAKIANSVTLGTKVNLTTLKVGDSNGTYYNPSESQTDLVHSVYSCNVTSVAVDETNSNWINVICAIPSDVGDFYIREAGVFDDTGALIAIGKYPETYKPTATDGSTKELYIKMTLEVTNTNSVELKIDPTVILATKNDINILANSIASISTQLSNKAKQTNRDLLTCGYRGLTIRNYTKGLFYTDYYKKKAIEVAKEVGSDTIAIVFNAYQSNISSNDIEYLKEDNSSRWWTTYQEVYDYCKYIKLLGYKNNVKTSC